MSSRTILSELSLRNLRFRRVKLSGLARREARTGLLFIIPWIVGFLLWILIPMVASFVFCFTNFDLIHPEQTRFIGLRNLVQLWNDPLARQSAVVSLRYALIALPIGIAQPILMAALLNARHLWARRLFTTLFYMPYIVPLVSAVYIWQGIMNDRTGWINLALEKFGINAPDWLNSTTWVYPALVVIGLWGVGDMLLLTLAAMQGIPTELYEAARVDGAGWTSMFRHITLPLITPVIFYNCVLSLIGIFQYFLVPYVLNGGTGEPGNMTFFYGLHLYKEAFQYSKMGYASTMSWVLFLFVLVLTVILFATAKYWVYYAAEEA